MITALYPNSLETQKKKSTETLRLCWWCLEGHTKIGIFQVIPRAQNSKLGLKMITGLALHPNSLEIQKKLTETL